LFFVLPVGLADLLREGYETVAIPSTGNTEKLEAFHQTHRNGCGKKRTVPIVGTAKSNREDVGT
jgi:hypothetical protein